jgi:hypothetical protein
MQRQASGKRSLFDEISTMKSSAANAAAAQTAGNS